MPSSQLLQNPSPLRVEEKLSEKGFEIGWAGRRFVMEVYPHPAMVRLFELKERIPYKRGTVVDRRRHFQKLQREIRKLIKNRLDELLLDAETNSLLQQPWSKDIGDQTDAFFCALIGYWHWLHAGRQSQVLGDLETGFLVVPRL